MCGIFGSSRMRVRSVSYSAFVMTPHVNDADGVSCPYVLLSVSLLVLRGG